MLERILKFLNLARVLKTEALTVVTPQLSGSWTRVVSENDVVLGWNFLCPCGWSGKYLHSEVHVEKIHRCNCGRAFQLRQSLVLNGAATKIMRKEAPQKTIGWVGEDFDGNFKYEPMR
jgi:hypothetical protein